MTRTPPLKFGIFMAPFHPVDQNPTLSLERDLQLITHLDQLGYDEAWIGEHHSAGYEIIASPEVFIAAASQRTSRIKLGTGVSSLPYHHPLILADRIVLLDHLTRGRVMFGVGPGALPSDAFMQGIQVDKQRDMMEESLDAILELLADEGPVNRETDWFTLRNARLQLRPYSYPCFDVAVAAQVSPSGPRLAGRHGLGLLSFGATTAAGFDAIGDHWTVMEQRAAEFGSTVDRAKWRLVAPMHLAETEEQARKDVQFGLDKWADYFQRVAALPLFPDGDGRSGRRPQQIGVRVDRLGGAGPGPGPAPGRPVGRIRHVPLPRPRVGRQRGHQALLRAVRPRGHAPLPGLDRVDRRVHGTGRRRTGRSSSAPPAQR